MDTSVLSIDMSKQSIKKKYSGKQVYYPYKDKRHIMTILNYLSTNNHPSTYKIADIIGKNWSHPQKRVTQMLTRLKELDYVTDFRLVTNTDHICNFCEQSSRYLVTTESLEKGIQTLENNLKHRDEVTKKPDFNPKDWFHCDGGFILGRLISMICFECYSLVNDPKHFDEQYKIHPQILWTLTQNGELAMLAILEGKKLYTFIKKHNRNKIIDLAKILLESGKKEYVKQLSDSLKRMMGIKSNLKNICEEWYDEKRNTIHDMKINKEKFPILAKYQENVITEKQREIILSARHGNFPRKLS